MLGDIPLIGPILFKQSLVGYLMYIAVIVVWVGLFKTKWGLRVRAVGEHPQAADTMGIKVNAHPLLERHPRRRRRRHRRVLLHPGRDRQLHQGDLRRTRLHRPGRLIFGRWNPIGAFFAALLFGFADNLQSIVTIIGTPVPSQFMAMLPYLVTVFAVAGLVGRSRPPAASGIPYVKG